MPEQLMQYLETRRVAIIGGNRIPFCRSYTGYLQQSNLQMMTAALNGLVERFNLQNKQLGDVALGSVIKHSRDWNMSREAVLSTQLAPETPAYDLQRACGTGLEAAIQIANKIALGQIDSGIAGGTDTVSDTPIVYPDSYRKILIQSFIGRSLGAKLKPWLNLRPKNFKPELPDSGEPRTNMSMGESTELTAKAWNISRAQQDSLAYSSHLKASEAWNDGFYNTLVSPFQGIERDNNIRSNTTIEKLAKLKNAFDHSASGTMTAGNSTPLTDGASTVLLASEEWAKKNNLPIQAYIRFGKVAAIDFLDKHPENLLLAPAYAVSEMLKDANLSLQDFDFYEIHEAFAAQTLATMKAWESAEFCRNELGRNEPLGSIDCKKLNTKGGSIAIGHPFAATGGRIIATLAKIINDNGGGRGLISICTAGGMGVSAIIEA
jgi:acetyl-CoA C-acetyltransferase